MRNDLECSHCGNEEFIYGKLSGQLKISLRFEVDVECSVCLKCGTVFTYVDDADLERLQSLIAGGALDA